MVKISRLKENKKALAICLVLAVIIVIGIIFIPMAYKYYKHKTTITKEEAHNNKQGNNSADKQDSKPLKPLWTKNSGKEFIYKFKASECDGEYTVTAPKDDGDITCSYQKDGEEYNASFYNLFNSVDLEDNNFPDTITGIKSSDIDFDGYTDLIITGTVDSKEKFWLQMGSENHQAVNYDDDKHLDDNSPDFTEFCQIHDQDMLAEERIENLIGPNFTVDDIDEWFVGNQKNGEFKSYVDAYKKVIDFYEYATPGEFTYKLIYFDDDDIPELTATGVCGGVIVSMYTFKDGRVSQLVDDWPFGAHGADVFKYKEKGNLLIQYIEYNYGQGTTKYYNGYGIIDGKLERVYQHMLMDEDKPINEWEFNEELTKKLTNEQREAYKANRDKTEDDISNGGSSCAEIFQQLGIPGFKVEKISGTSSTFNFDEKKFHYEVESLKNNKKVFHLSDGTSSTKQTLKCDDYKAFLLNRDDDRAYLYLVVNLKDDSSLYIFNLNTKSIIPPTKYDGEYQCKDDIENSYGFTMIADIMGIGIHKAKKEFYVGVNGMPIQSEPYGYFIKTNPKDDSSGNNEFGDALVLQKDFTCAATKDLSEKYIWCSEDYPEGDGKAEMVSFKEGAKFYLYKYRYEYYKDTIDLVHYYLVNDDGYMIEIQVDYDDGGVIKLNEAINFKAEK